METKVAVLLMAAAAIALVSGCIATDEVPADSGTGCQPPKKMIGDVCCNDENDNDLCDIDEITCPESCDDGDPCTNDTCSIATRFKCEHETIVPCCGNGVCEPKEELENVCSEDCELIDMTDILYSGTPDFMDGETFVFIHTTATEENVKLFYANISAGILDMKDVRYTFRCNSTQNNNIDSITSTAANVTLGTYDVGKWNVLDNSAYTIQSNFYVSSSTLYRLEIDELDAGDSAKFQFRIEKKDPQKRDDLSCLFRFYFVTPKRMVQKPLKISYI